jgi:hypothetical protein
MGREIQISRNGIASSAGRGAISRRAAKRASMAEITHFVALAFDFVDGVLVAGEGVDCANPAVAIQTAQGQWKLFGHAGAVAFSRTSDFEQGKFDHRHVLRRFGQVPEEYLRENDDE